MKLGSTLTSLLLVLVFLFSAAAVRAQRTVQGTVRDAEGNAIMCAAVKVVGRSGMGTLCDMKGQYTLRLPDTATYTLEASMLGMESARWTTDKPHSMRHDFTLRESATNMQTVVVTATRTPKTLMDVPMVTRVIDASDIQSSDASTVQDLLQTELPGIEFSYSMNQQVSLNMQGFAGNSVLFLIDGERLAGETMDNVDYSRLTLSDVGRVEVVKGAASSLYGSNAVGGVVNLISHTSTEPWTLQLSARHGTHNDNRYCGQFSLHRNRWTSVSNVQWAGVDAIHLSDSGELRDLFANHSLTVRERLIFQANDHLRLTGRASYFFRERESAVDLYDRYRDFSGGMKGEYSFNDWTNWMLSYAFDQYDKSDYGVTTGYDVRDYSNVQHTVRSLFNRTFGTVGTLTAGGDVMRDYLMSYQFDGEGSHEQYTADVFTQWDWNITDRFSAVAALRFDYFSQSAQRHFSPKLNLMYRFPSVSLRASYADGFRAPTLKEMFMHFDMANLFMIYGNPALRPESSDNFSLSAEWNRDNYNLTAMGYYNHVKDRINTAWNSARGGMVYGNMAPVDIKGADISASARWNNGLGVRISYIYTHEQVGAGVPNTSQTRPHTATARVDYSREWKAGTTCVAISGRALSAVTCDVYTDPTDMTRVERQTYPGYFLLKATASHRFGHGIVLNLTLDNLLNYRPEYYYNNSPATPGRTVALGLLWNVEQAFKK